MIIVLSTETMAAEPWRKALAAACQMAGLDAQVNVWSGTAMGARYAVVWLPPPELFALETQLRAVFNLGAGVDALLAAGAVPNHLPILRLLDAGMAPKMAEYVCFAIARITRGLDRFAPQVEFDWNAQRPRGAPAVVGVLGLGAIGAPIATAVANFGYRVRGWSRSARSVKGVEAFAGAAQFEPFLAHTDILVNALPLTSATENLLDRRAFGYLPRGAHVINVGRGGTIADADLIAVLDSGQLASATLDVFPIEPLPVDHPFRRHAKITVTPHLSGPTPRAPACEQIIATLLQLERGAPPASLPGYVDRVRGY